MATQQDLEDFVTQVTPPDDFDDFWSGTLEQLSQIALKPVITADPLRSNADVHVFNVTYLSLGGLEISAWYSLPAQGNGPFPAVINFPGYKSEPPVRRDWGKKGVAVLSVAVRGKLKSSAEFNPGYPGLLTSGLESKEAYGYRGVIADCVRGVVFLRSRPEIDPERLYACGSSQGGGLTLITSALRPEIKAGFPVIHSYAVSPRPWPCSGRIPTMNWPATLGPTRSRKSGCWTPCAISTP